MEPTQVPLAGDDVAEEYKKAQEQGAPAQACTAITEAEAQLADGDFEKALKSAKQALDLFKSSGKAKGGPGDALRLVIKALVGQGKPDEALKTAQSELAAFRSAKDRLGEAAMLVSVAELKCSLRSATENEEAQLAAEEAQAIFQEQKAGRMQVIAMVTLAWAHILKEGDKDGAVSRGMATAKKAHVLSQEVGYKGGEAKAMHALAVAQALGGMLQECIRSADEALDVYLEVKDHRMAAYEWLCMAKWHLDSGSPDQALSDAENAQETYEMLGSPLEAKALMVIFKAHSATGKPQRARRAVKDAVARFEEAGDRRGEAAALEVLFQVYKAMGKPREALNAASRATAIYKTLGDVESEMRQLGTISGLHFSVGQHEKAVEAGESALPLVQKTGTREQKIELMQALADSHTAMGNLQKASEVVGDMQQHFTDMDDNHGSAAALMSACAIALAQDKHDEAARAASNAHAIYNEEEDSRGEANSLRMLCEIHTKKEEHKAAVRAAETAKAHYTELGDKAGETAMLYLLSQNAALMAIKEGARVNESSRASRASKEALSKAAKAVVIAVKQARELPNGQQLLACSLCTQSQVEMLQNRPQDALKAADEGIVLFRDGGDTYSEASALLLAADALRMTMSYKEAQEAAKEALRLFKEVEDFKGQDRAQELLDFLQQYLRPVQTPTPQMAAAAQMPMQQVDFSNQGAGEPQGGGGAVARTDRPKGPALDLSGGVDEDTIKNKVMEIASRITGADDGEIELDTPLMEAGLTSNSAILLRDELSQELPGIDLPVTLVFDYPSIAAMSELIVETSAKAIKN